MLLHGDADTDVPVVQSIQMDELLKNNGVPVELFVVPKGGHGFDGKGLFDPVAGPCLARVIDFVVKHVSAP